MSNLNMYCITINDDHYQLIKKLNYSPVGLGEKIKLNNFIRDNTKINISKKNPYYGEYTFHYWLWKNYLDKIKTPWIGFCQYRKFFSKNELITNQIKFEDLERSIIKQIDENGGNFDCILGKKFYTENIK